MTERLQETKGVDNVVGPYDGEVGQISRDGHSALVTFELPGDSKTAEENVVGTLAAVDAAAKANPELRIEQAGDASINKAALEKSNAEMGKSALFSIPLTLLILVFAFGALVAAGIPLLLALTSVGAHAGPAWPGEPDRPGRPVRDARRPAGRDGRRRGLQPVLPEAGA